jgi:hypothetical protein
MPFVEAVTSHGVRQVMPTSMTTAELREVAASIRSQSFFSARNTITSALDRAKEVIADILEPRTQQRTLEDGTIQEFTAGMNPDEARLEIKRALAAVGYMPAPEERGTITDLSSDRRVDLVVDTNVRLAQGWGQDRQAQEVTDAFPAWELIRAESREKERDWKERFLTAGRATGMQIGDGWTITEDGRMLALQNHPIWEKLGSTSLFPDALDTDVPPYAFSSGMDRELVSFEEAVAAGIIAPGQRVEPVIKDYPSASE